jgi:hypothetical protein
MTAGSGYVSDLGAPWIQQVMFFGAARGNAGSLPRVCGSARVT